MVPMTLPDVPATPAPAAPAPAPKKPLRRGVLIAIIAGGLVLLLGLGAAAFALVNLVLGGGQSPSASAVAFPKSTVYWAEFAIDPSISQKTEAFRFVNEIDALQDAIEDSDLDVDLDDPSTYSDFKKSVWELLVDEDVSGVDTDLDYDDDVAPWLGSRVSVGMLPSDDLEDPSLIIAIEARDTTAGIEAIEQLVDDLDVDAEVDEHNGYVIVSTGDVDLDDVYDDGTLNQDEKFAKASSAAGEWGWASVYVDLGALYSMVNEASTGDYDDVDYWIDEIENNYYSYVDDSAYEDYEDCSAYDAPENVGNEDYEDFECDYYYEYDGEYYEYYDDFAMAYVEDHAEELAEEKVDEYADYADQQAKLVESLEGSTAFIVSRFVDASFEVSGVVSGVKDLSMARSSGDDESQLPASTVALLSISGLAEALDNGLTDENLALQSGGLSGYSPYGFAPTDPVTRDDVVDWFDDELGLDFPDDLTDLFGAKVQVVLDSDLDLDAVEGGDGSLGDVAESGAAIVITTDDADATASAWEDLLDTAEDNLDTKLGIDVEQDGKRVIISGGDYLETVVDPDERLGDLEAFRRAVPQHETASALLYLDVAGLADLYGDVAGGGDSLDFLDGVQALGFTTRPLSGDSYSFVLRVTTEAD